GYPMVRHAKQLIASGELGKVLMVHVQYAQSWLASPLELTGHKQASWRTDPQQAGAGCLGDIGSHAFQLAEFVSGCMVEKICGDVHTCVPGRKVDDNVQLLLRFSNGASGMLWASQVAHGHDNDLQLRVYCTKGSIQWKQKSPEQLLITREGAPTSQVMRGATGTPTSSTGLPGGHPEGFIEAFSRLYADYAEQLIARREKQPPSPMSLLAPTGETGLRVMSFIDTALRLPDNGSWLIIE
ncbi:MAG: Gfo/Idh/MocA family oxidoreductase, partial [Steroidobacter sp.]